MPDLRGVRAVVLDYSGVMTIHPSAMVRGPDNALDAGVDRGALRRVIGRILAYDEPDSTWARLERGEIPITDFLAEVEREAPGASAVFDPALGAPGFAGLTVRADMVERARALRDAGFATALLTNNVAEWRPIWRANLPLTALFDDVVDSSEVGMRKPEPRIFRLVLERLGVAPHEVLFVDDFPVNVEAARAVGLHAVLADGADSHLPILDGLLAGAGADA